MRQNVISETELLGEVRRVRDAEGHLGMTINERNAEIQIGLIRSR